MSGKKTGVLAGSLQRRPTSTSLRYISLLCLRNLNRQTYLRRCDENLSRGGFRVDKICSQKYSCFLEDIEVGKRRSTLQLQSDSNGSLNLRDA
jgi:hypothetical protein